MTTLVFTEARRYLVILKTRGVENQNRLSSSSFFVPVANFPAPNRRKQTWLTSWPAFTNMAAVCGKLCGPNPPDQNERPNDRVLLIFVNYNLDLIKFLAHTCEAPEVYGLCSAEHVRTFLNPALLTSC